MLILILSIAIASTVLCYACLEQGAKADESSEYQYNLFLQEQVLQKRGRK